MNDSSAHDIVLAIARHFGLRPQGAERIVGRGTVNEVWRVEGSPYDAIVRLNHDRDSESALAEYRKEAWCYRTMAAEGRPTPEFLGVGLWEGRAYLAHRFVEGRTGEDIDGGKAWHRLGEWAAAVHRVILDAEAGEHFPSRFGGPEAEWRGQRQQNLECLGPADPLLRLGVYREDEIPQLRDLFNGLPDGPLGLCHGDVAPRNLVVAENGESVLIDWGCATVHLVPHHELEELLRGHLLEENPNAEELQAFAEGYGWTGAELTGIHEETKRYVVLKAFDLVRWAIDRCPSRLEELTDRAKRVWAILGRHEPDPGLVV